jgi:hypothetical protein
MAAVEDRFKFDDLTEVVPAANWIWVEIIVPLQEELKAAEALAEDANSGFNKGLDY